MAALRKAYDKSLVAAIEREKKIIGEARDRLRELIEDADAVANTADDAVDSLSYAIEQLSQYV